MIILQILNSLGIIFPKHIIIICY